MVKNEEILPCIIEASHCDLTLYFNPKGSAHSKIDSRIQGMWIWSLFPNIEAKVKGQSRIISLPQASMGGIVLGASNPVILGVGPRHSRNQTESIETYLALAA